MRRGLEPSKIAVLVLRLNWLAWILVLTFGLFGARWWLLNRELEMFPLPQIERATTRPIPSAAEVID